MVMDQLSGIAKTENLDTLTRTHTAFSTFAELIATADNSDYFPSLTRQDDTELADAYDAAMERRGDARRAWRDSQHQNHRLAA